MTRVSSRLCPHCMQMSDSELCPHCGKNVNYTGQPMHLPAGYVVSGKHPYVLGAALGQGGFGITYIALDMVTNARVAIKEYYPTYCSARTNRVTVTAYSSQEDVYLKGRERFLDEARTLKSLSDLPNIVNVLDFFELNNTAYLVMEFLEGSSLKEYAAENGAFPAKSFLKQLRPLMEDIQKMHDRGVIHRDIAPDNIILQPDGRMKLIDFGAARSYVGDKSMTVVVKKGFAPLEQYFSSGSTTGTDVYALAATIYYCITGKVPMDSAQRQNEDVPLASPVSLGADITPEQESALMNALEVQQKARTQSVKAFMEGLDAPAKISPKTDNVPQIPDDVTKPEKPGTHTVKGTPQTDTGTRKKRFGKKWIALISAAVLAAALILFLTTADQRKYDQAREHLSRKQYAQAAELFVQLDDYENSHSLWTQTIYAWAEDLVEKGQYDEALDKLADISKYNKTAALVNEIHYQRGKAYYNDKKYEKAYQELSLITGSYKDTADFLRKTKIDWATYIINNEKLGDAQNFVKNVKLTQSESEAVYDLLICKKFYSLSNGSTEINDFQTRAVMLDALSGNYPLKESLRKLFTQCTEYTADEFIRNNRDLIKKLWDVPVMQDIITENWNLCIWLLGLWKADSGAYLKFYEKENDDSIWCSYTLPYVSKPKGTKYWDIIDMTYIWTDEDSNELAKVYKIELLTPETISVYCYKNQKTYKLTLFK